MPNLHALETQLQTLYRERMRKAQPLSEADLARKAVVFAPHPDDETLGCGGTIIRKKQAGAQVKVVFLTDGSGSHQNVISRDKLRTIRASEALAACRKLGLSQRDVIFLGFPDGQLARSQNEALSQVRDLLIHIKPQQVFIPYRYEPPADHAVANHIVRAAIRSGIVGVPTIFEYPVWFWYHWPWVALRQGRRPDTRTVLRLTLRTAAGARMAGLFRHNVDISQVLDQKRAALAEHHSQMERLMANTYWPVLADVSGGAFLNCFFADREVFYREK